MLYDAKKIKVILFDYLVEALEMTEIREEWALNYCDQLQSQGAQSPMTDESKRDAHLTPAEKEFKKIILDRDAKADNV